MIKNLTQEDARKLLMDVPAESVFWLKNGRVLWNLQDLQKELSEMDENTFSYHVNKEKNDFSSWIRDVVKDKELANDISNAATIKQMLRILNRRIEHLNKNINQQENKEQGKITIFFNQHKELSMFIVLVAFITGFLAIAKKSNFSSTPITGNVVTDVGGLNPSYLILMLFVISIYTIIVVYFINIRHKNIFKKT